MNFPRVRRALLEYQDQDQDNAKRSGTNGLHSFCEAHKIISVVETLLNTERVPWRQLIPAALEITLILRLLYTGRVDRDDA